MIRTEMRQITLWNTPVATLTGRDLNWAVAHALGIPIYRTKRGGWMTAPYGEFNGRIGIPYWAPSTNWAQGGQIIEREGVTLIHQTDRWAAQTDEDLFAYGPTPLIAAMRCLVASKVGTEIHLPEGESK